MGSIYGKNVKISVFGESHGQGIGVVIDNIKSGLFIDDEFIKSQMDRRRPGKNKFSTKRKEMDEYEILSGVFNGRTTGLPLCAFIRNKNNKSRDYSNIKDVFRPSHADFTGYIRYDGFNDYRGSGHFSGRLTAPIVFAGSIAKLILKEKNINIKSHIKRIKNIKDVSYMDMENIKKDIKDVDFPVIDYDVYTKMKEEIDIARNKEDSIGGVVEVCIENIDAGIGDPIFETIEGRLAKGIFAIPGVKGLEFGMGFSLADYYGSEVNDEYDYKDNNVITKTNNNGGILGGITNGMPVIFSVALKPTPSISKEQNTINKDNQNVKLKTYGRHDPCIVPRACVVLEAITAITILDILYGY